MRRQGIFCLSDCPCSFDAGKAAYADYFQRKAGVNCLGKMGEEQLMEPRLREHSIGPRVVAVVGRRSMVELCSRLVARESAGGILGW